MTRQPLIDAIRHAVIGDDTAVMTPFGLRRVTYANSHTENSGTGRQTTRFREEARRIIRDALGANAEEHAVIFAGSGCTGAIDRLVGILGLRIPAELDERHGLTGRIPREQRPVVFVGPYEHHSNELPWRESIADVVVIDEDADGQIDLGQLRGELERFAERPLKIGSFSAASNVTGIESDTLAVTAALHRGGALSFWDFPAAGPYKTIDMNPSRRDPALALADKDAVFLSPHKFVGGPGTPGVLVAKRKLFRNRVPTVPGGGTVAYVNRREHDYLRDPEHREEGGT